MAQLLGTSTSAATQVALEADAIDWIKWESTGTPVRKSGGGSLIGTYTTFGTITPTQYTNDPRTITWSGGTPTATGKSTNGVYGNAITTSSGFQVVFPADTGTRIINLYYGLFSAQGTLTATLSDASAGPLTLLSITTAANASGDFNAQIIYSAASAGQTLTVQWALTTIVSGAGNVTVCGANMLLWGAGEAPGISPRRLIGPTVGGPFVNFRSPLTQAYSLPAALPPTATIAQNLGALTQAANVTETIPSTIAQKLSGLRQSATVSEVFSTTIAQRLGGLRQSLAVNSAITTATIAQTLGGLRQSATVSEIFATTIAQRLGGLRQSLNVTQGDNATIAQRLGGLRQSLNVIETMSTTIAQRLGGLRQSLNVNSAITSATIAQTLGGLRQSLTVAEVFSTTIAQRLGGLRQSLAVTQGDNVTIAQRLAGLRQALAAAESYPTTVVQHLGGLRQSATVAEKIPSTIAQHLVGLRQSLAAAETIPSTVAQRLSGLRQLLNVTVATGSTVTTSIAQRLGALVQEVTVMVPPPAPVAVVNQRLSGLRQLLIDTLAPPPLPPGTAIQFDPASIAQLLATLTARAVARQLTLAQTATNNPYLEMRIPGSEAARTRGLPPYALLTIAAVYKSPTRRRPVFGDNPALRGYVQRYEEFPGIQRTFGPVSIIVDRSNVLVGQGLLLSWMQQQFDLLDLRALQAAQGPG